MIGGRTYMPHSWHHMQRRDFESERVARFVPYQGSVAVEQPIQAMRQVFSRFCSLVLSCLQIEPPPTCACLDDMIPNDKPVERIRMANDLRHYTYRSIHAM